MCSFLVWKNASLNYREFDLEGDLVGVLHTWYLSAQSFIRLIKLVWREYDIVAMNEWKKKWVGLQRTWVSKRTVLGNQIWLTPSIKVIPFSKYLSFHLGVVLDYANWANLIFYTHPGRTLFLLRSVERFCVFIKDIGAKIRASFFLFPLWFRCEVFSCQ